MALILRKNPAIKTSKVPLTTATVPISTDTAQISHSQLNLARLVQHSG